MKKIFIISFIILGIIIFWFTYKTNTKEYQNPDIHIVKNLIYEDWGSCTTPEDWCDEVLVEINKRFDGWYVTALYTGIKDNSIFAIKRESLILNVHHSWYLGPATKEYSCTEGKGHRDFSPIPCK